MATGVSVNDECLNAYSDLKSRKRFKYIIFSLNDTNSEIIVAEAQPAELTSNSDQYDAFKEKLPEDQCRYAVFDFEFDKEDGGRRNKICFISWTPDGSKIKQKMVYAASREALRKSLDGIQVDIQGTDYDEVALDTVFEKCNKSR